MPPKIPKKLHFVWVGDETKCPDNCINTWRDNHPDYELRVWGNKELATYPWVNKSHMDAMYKKELCGVADLMRYEILLNEGGIAIDADSISLRKLDESFRDNAWFASWENERIRPGLIAMGCIGSLKQNPIIFQIVKDIRAEKTFDNLMAWQAVGPKRLTDSVNKYGKLGLKIYPSHYFLPEHFAGDVYKGDGPVYARQLWGSTKRLYGDLCDQSIEEMTA